MKDQYKDQLVATRQEATEYKRQWETENYSVFIDEYNSTRFFVRGYLRRSPNKVFEYELANVLSKICGEE